MKKEGRNFFHVRTLDMIGIRYNIGEILHFLWITDVKKSGKKIAYNIPITIPRQCFFLLISSRLENGSRNDLQYNSHTNEA